MISPLNAAKDVLNKYFLSKGEETPHARAHRFIPRITFRGNCFWRSDTLRETAAEIIASACFDIDDLVERFLGVDLAIEPLQDLDKKTGAPVLGIARVRKREIAICVRAERYLPLYRATLAHELGHILLHSTNRSPTLNYSPDSPRRPRHELEADRFMVALLVSWPTLLLTILFHADAVGISAHEAICNANSVKGRWQWKNLLFRPLIDDLCLSRQFLAYQLQAHGVFNADTVSWHFAYALRTKWQPDGNTNESWTARGNLRGIFESWMQQDAST